MHDSPDRNDRSQAQAPIHNDANVPSDAPVGGVRNLKGLVEAADLVADVILISGTSHVPAPLRIIVTDYTFQVQDAIKGAAGESHLLVRNQGGELADGTGMDNVDAYKLMVGGRYLIFGRKTAEGYWLTYVLQIGTNGSVVATPDGRMIVGLRQGDLLTQVDASLPSLRYRPSPPAPATHRQDPPDKGSLPLPRADELLAPSGTAPVTLDQVKHALRDGFTEKKLKSALRKSTIMRMRRPTCGPGG